MLMINDCFQTHVFKPQLQGFLTMLKHKASHGTRLRKGLHTARLDELYGIVPPFEIRWHLPSGEAFQQQIREWGLSGVLELSCEWDNLRLEFWNYAGKFHCVQIDLMGSVTKIQTRPVFQPELFINLFHQAEKRLNLIYSAYSNTFFKITGVREYICNFLQREPDTIKRNFLIEVFITLLAQKLTKEEEQNQNAFGNRANHFIQNIIRYRAEALSATQLYKTMFGVLALRGCLKMDEELMNPVSMIWGFLINQQYYQDQIDKSEDPACFCERYYPNGKVHIGEITPVTKGEKSEMMILPRYDLYKQVFPNYETAIKCRNVALDILRRNQKQK